MRVLFLALLATTACQQASVRGFRDPLPPPNPPALEAESQTDRSVQTPVPAVDVLWVVDNSCSMAEEQNALARNFGAFINYFVGSGLDYHVGVVSTGFDDPKERGLLLEGRGEKWIDADTPEPVAVFRDMAEMGTNGENEEKGRDQVYGAIELLGMDERLPNWGFYREEAALAVIVISDEDDSSRVTSVREFIDWMDDLKDEDDRVSFSSIVGPPGGCANAAEGTSYLQITREVGGIEWSICDSNWSAVLEELGIQAAGLKREFYLSAIPVEGTVEVWVETDGQKEPYSEGRDWEYSRVRNSVRFNEYVPEPFAEVYMSYEPLSAARESAGQ